jgi:phosphatidylglycerol:prolipoprotein diacylglycerol transferase
VWHDRAVHPVLFSVFGESVHAYAFFSVVGYAAGVILGVAMGLRDGRRWRELFDLALVVVIGALFGSKLFHTLFEARGHRLRDGSTADGVLDLLRDDPWHAFRLFEAGYVFYGGVVVAIFCAWLYTVRQRVADRGGIGDYAVPGLLFGIFVGRIGCFLAGCCYGSDSDVPWAVVFPAGHPSGGHAVHPVQLYDAAYGLAGLIALALLYPRRRFSGEPFCAFVVSYATFRFCTEMFRADADRGVWLGGLLSTSQLVALATVPVTIYFWRRALRLVRAGKLRKPGEPLAAWEQG